MNIKLFIVMGVSWIIEIVTTFTPNLQDYLNFADIFNIFQGVLVFFIFVFKRKVLHELQQKLGMLLTICEFIPRLFSLEKCINLLAIIIL